MDRCRIVIPILLTVVSAVALPAAGSERDRAKAELDALRARIDTLQEELGRTGRKRTRAEKLLKKAEQDEQAARRELARLREQSRQARRREAELRATEARQQAAVDEQREALGRQLRSSYVNGNSEWLRIVLSQQNPAELGRRMTYYRYFGRYRQRMIGELEQALTAIAATRAELAAELARLRQLEADAADTLETIANTRAERAAAVVRLSKELASGDAEIQSLKAQAEELTALIEKLAKRLPAMPDFDAAPFAGQTARLSWPADGPVLRSFGEPRADGSLRWNGVLLGAPAGSAVRAVYHGRVVFSDWLAGMGLLTIVEHDDGYMSLYGHNQDLLKEVGDWVAPGEVIAHVGDSGGQANAGLYFEIRKDGEPVDPGNWLQ